MNARIRQTPLQSSVAWLLSILMCVTTLTLGASPAQAIANAGDDFTYTTNDSGLTITGLSDKGKTSASDGAVEIPVSINGTTVTEIGDGAFFDAQLDSVDFPDTTLESIGSRAFNTNNITQVEVNVKNIKEGAFAHNGLTTVTLGETVTIGADAFRDNNIDSIDFGGKLETLGARALLNNNLSTVNLPDTIKSIEDSVFSINHIEEVDIPDGLETLGSTVFSRNGRWVKLITESDAVSTQSYESGYGQVLNPVTITVKYVDDKGNTIQPNKTLGADASSPEDMYGKGEKATLNAPSLDGYTFSYSRVGGSTNTSVNNPVEFTPDTDGYEVTLVYTKRQNDPTISVESGKTFAAGATVTEADLLQGVTAKDYKGVDITSRITVSPTTIDTNTPGRHRVYYTVEDTEGNTTTVESSVMVGQDWGKLEVGGGWLVEDFTYNNNYVTGFSSTGTAKLNSGNKDLYLPTYNTSGTIVTHIEKNSFSSKGLESIKDFGKIQVIGDNSFENNSIRSIQNWGDVRNIGKYSFKGNSGLSLPDSWGKITTIGEGAFMLNNMEHLPQSWGDVTYISRGAFYKNSLTSLPESWGNITTLGGASSLAYGVFDSNSISHLPESWGKISSIDDYSFRSNKIESIPGSWGDITRIGISAFYDNSIPEIPNEWGNVSYFGNYAFSKNKITSIPRDWGLNSTIANNAFFDNLISSVPESWGGVKKIGMYSFSKNNINKLPDSWGGVTDIDAEAFSYNSISSIPDSWGSITKIKSGTFSYNSISSIPDSWGSVSLIESGAFSNNLITSLPDSWGSLKAINSSVFSYNKIESLPLSWGSITSLGESSFSYNEIKEIPLSWDNISTIGSSVFFNNKIEDIPNSWGLIRSIPMDAFSINNIHSIPDSWGNVTYIGKGAFYDNDISALPYSWGNVVTLDPPYQNGTKVTFGKNKLPPGNTFSIKDNLLTSTFVLNMMRTQAVTSLGVTYLYTENGTNPNNVASTYNIIINPITVTVKYVDEQGNMLAPSTSYLTAGNKSETFSAIPIQGYAAIADTTVTLPGTGEYTQTFTYTKLTQEQIDAQKKTNLSLVTGTSTNTEKKYLINGSTDMTGNITVDRTGFSSDPLVDPIIRVNFDNAVYTNSVKMGISTTQYTNLVVKDNYFTFQYKGTINSGTRMSIPFQVQFKNRETPANTKFYINAAIIDSADNNVIATSNKDYFIGYYGQPNSYVTSNGQRNGGRIGTYDKVTTTGSDGYVSETGVNSINYSVAVESIPRNISAYTMTVSLPTYEVHKDSSTSAPLSGHRAYAQFVPEENPGWVLSSDKKSVVYTGDNNGTSSIIRKPLVLHYPGAVEQRSFSLSHTTVLTPTGKTDTEPVLVVNNTIANSFYKWTPPAGKVFDKDAVGMQEYGVYFYDNIRSRSEEFGWSLSFNAYEQDLTNVVMTDKNLDSRMHYTRVSIPETFGAGSVVAYNSQGGSVWSSSFDGSQYTSLDIPANVQSSISYLEFSSTGAISKGTAGQIMVYSRLNNISESIYDATPGSTSNDFNNTLSFSSDQTQGEDSAHKTVRPLDQSILATKTSTYGKEILTGAQGVYTVGFRVNRGYGEDIYNFEQVDLLPIGLEVSNYTMSSQFMRVPGAAVKTVANYNGSGHTAVIWTAPMIPYSVVTPDAQFTVGTINTYVDVTVPSGTLVNDVFVRADNATEVNPVSDARLPSGTWSKARTSSDVTASEMLLQKKSIRTYDENNTATEWRSHADTYPGQKMDYQLKLSNGTDVERTGVQFYDVLPTVGDLGIGGAGVNTPRGSEISNRLDTTRSITVPAGMKVQYYNSDTPVPAYTGSTAGQVLEGLSWSDSPAANTRAIRVVPEEGHTVTLAARQSMDVIIPMVANEQTQDNIAGIPSAATAGKTAYNTFFQRDDAFTNLLEGNRVSNTMVSRAVNITLRKTGVGGADLAGARFEYHRANGSVVSSAISDAQGSVLFANITPQVGDTVVEVQAPNGYLTSDEQRVITQETLVDSYNAGNGVINLGDWANYTPLLPIEPMVGNVEFTKVDANGSPLSGVTFELSRQWDFEGTTYSKLYTAKSNAQGLVSFANVAVGSGYILKEVSAPRNLSVITPVSNVTVNNNATTYLGATYKGVPRAIANDKAQVTINKIGVTEDRLKNQDGTSKKFGEFGAIDGTGLSGATLVVKRLDTGATVQTVTSATAGNTVSNLIPGVKYSITETKTPTGYNAVPGLTMEFMVNSSGYLTDLNGVAYPVQTGLYIPNTPTDKVSTVTITKQDNNNVKLSGAQFVLEKKDDQGVWAPAQLAGQSATQTTPTTGIVSWTSVPFGDYRVRETRAPVGYYSSAQVYNFTVNKVTAQTFTNTFINRKTLPVVHKVEYLAKGLTRIAAQQIADSMKNNGNVTLVQNGQQYDVVRNLAGAQFALRTDPAGANLETFTTDSQGVAKLSTPLDEKTTYYVVETQAPAGYTLSSKPHVFTVADYVLQTGFTGAIDMYIPNAQQHGTMVVSKINSATGEPILSGTTTFMVRSTTPDAEGNFWEKEVHTDEKTGVAFLDDMPLGTYTVTETRSAQGYIVDNTPREFTLSQDNSTYNHVFGNTPGNSEVTIKKMINGHDANGGVDTVLLSDGKDTMDVTFTVTNTGTTPLNNVAITDVVTQGGDADSINTLLAGAQVELSNNESALLNTTNGPSTNGQFTMIPGSTATVTIKAQQPGRGVLHSDTGTVSGSYGGKTVTDDDEAHALGIDVGVTLPETGTQGLAIIGLLFLLMVGAAYGFWRRNRK